MLTTLLLALVFLAAILLVLISTRPNDFRVTRSARIPGPTQTVFAHVADLRKWEAWSPWARMDPNAKTTYSGTEAGVGQAMSWAGNSKVGEGAMTIAESHPSDLVRFQLDFRKPMAATHMAEFTFKPDGDHTLVTWTMTGQNKFLSKAFGLVVDCDKMIGGQFEQGLANLRQVIEGSRG